MNWVTVSHQYPTVSVTIRPNGDIIAEESIYGVKLPPKKVGELFDKEK